eukprot:TRINITY_DN23850_c0_g3_i1.p1 TRINITY_DN23850_c0_g3~~TRINITY_DN23850_c0_g3_i1.p1  ORF type:complete len:892 (+),score=183.65 TRINITY_DN23850_c0_g3_i1:147-2822(+)
MAGGPEIEWLGGLQGIHGAFPDYDCRWAGAVPGSSAYKWSDLRSRLSREAWGAASPLAHETAELARYAAEAAAEDACPLGRLAACLALWVSFAGDGNGGANSAAVPAACWPGRLQLPLVPALASTWPVLRLLSIAQRQWPERSEQHSCIRLFHPSLDWDAYHALVEAYGAEEFQEEEMESVVTDAHRDAADHSSGIVWKYSSMVQYQGLSIAAWTGQCTLGAATAFILRIQGLVLGELDVYKMVEALLKNVDDRVLSAMSLEEILASRWPIFALLHKLQCTRRRYDDLALAPNDLQLNINVPEQNDAVIELLSEPAREIAEHLLVAAPGPVLVTFVRTHRVGYLRGYMRHSDALDFLGRSLILPQSQMVRDVCEGLGAATGRGAPCLPVLSVYPELAKFALLALAARLGVSVLFADLETYFAQNPFKELVPMSRASNADVHVALEFYSNQTRPGLLLVHATERSLIAMASIAIWLVRFPFSVEGPALRYMLEPDRPGYVPSVSFLRADRREGLSEAVGPVRLGQLCSENRFVTSDGWFGDIEDIVAYELQSLMYAEEKVRALEAFYEGPEWAPRVELLRVQKEMSPKRPMEVLQHGADPCGNSLHAAAAMDSRSDSPPYVLHVNFADGCCEREQAKSSSTALQFGANDSWALGGAALDAEFRERNSRLLNWRRTEQHTQGKTPSGKVGYYVWKPYVILQTLLDPRVRDGDIVLWTDAGVHFIAPLRPLLERYLENSDVSATETPMMEADVTKRDALILLDADYLSILQTNQIATGIILARKTPLAIRFMQHWLRACEDERIITEEPSSLGQPDYFTFRHHNDDQSAFSLLFKKYGFKAFSQAERDEVVLAARNIAKFRAVSDAFALGETLSQDNYIAAADGAAISSSSSSA